MRANLALLWLLISIPTAFAELNCTVSNSTCTYTELLHLYRLNNSHAEQANESNYDYIVCCRETNGINLNTTCGTSVINLSKSANAHVEKLTGTDYAYSICLNPNNGTITCTYQTSACSQACIGTIPSIEAGRDTSLHISDCTTYPFQTKICCSYSEPPPTSSESTQPSSGFTGRGGAAIADELSESVEPECQVNNDCPKEYYCENSTCYRLQCRESETLSFVGHSCISKQLAEELKAERTKNILFYVGIGGFVITITGIVLLNTKTNKNKHP